MAGRVKGKPGSSPRASDAGAPGASKSVRWPRLATLVIAAVVIVGGGFYYGRSRSVGGLPAAIPVARGAAAGFNVALITLDTLRADRLRCYGYGPVETPALDALAATGIRFADAVTPVPITLPSHCTILTGEYPPRHGARDNGTFRLVAEHLTLAEYLKAEGYATAAFIGAFVLEKRFGLAQGFDVYDDDFSVKTPGAGRPGGWPQRPGNAVLDSTIRWLDAHQTSQPNKPFFVWVHLFDPHLPYTPPEPFRTLYASNLYDGEVAFTDSQVGRFVNRLRELELLDKTLILAVGDHGEGLGDHGESAHSLLIYESTMRVPLILWGPPVIPKGRVVDDRVVATVDLMPTILDLLGLDPPDCDGASLLRATEDSDRVVYMETLAPELNHGWSPLFGSRRHHDKYIEAPAPEYFDLRNDPQELSNLVANRTRAADELQQRLTALMASFPDADAAATVTPDEETLRKLQALGYVGGRESAPAGTCFDPKDMVAMWERKITAANRLIAEGNVQESLPLLKGLLKITLHDPGVWALLSQAQTQAGQFEQALESRMQAIELQPTDPDHWLQVAWLEYLTGDIEAARRALREGEHLQPDHGRIYLLRAEFARAAGDYPRAVELCEEGRRRDPARHTATTWAFQGKLYEEMGQLEDARSAYQQAHGADPLNPAALLGLAGVADRDGHHERVVELAGRIRRSDNEWYQSRVLLARAYGALEKPDQAIRVMQELAAALPGNAETHKTLGDVLYVEGRHAEAAEAYNRALELDSEDAKTLYKLGVILRERGEVQAAIERFREAFIADNSMHQALLALARIHVERGEMDQGLTCLGAMLQRGTLTLEQVDADPALKPLTKDPRYEELRRSLEKP